MGGGRRRNKRATATCFLDSSVRFLGETEGATKGDVVGSGALLKSLECDDGDAASGCCRADRRADAQPPRLRRCCCS